MDGNVCMRACVRKRKEECRSESVHGMGFATVDACLSLQTFLFLFYKKNLKYCAIYLAYLNKFCKENAFKTNASKSF